MSPSVIEQAPVATPFAFPDEPLATYAYTIGCFDMLHKGHIRLFNNMRRFGKKLVVGIHDDESIIRLKRRVPMEDTATRVANVAKYAEHVYVIRGTDPTPFIEEVILHMKAHYGQTYDNAVYIRGDDMPRFPSRDLVEQHMRVILLPYTVGVSSTLLRKQILEQEEGQKALAARESEFNHVLSLMVC
eukprot:Colp12_sorted_trinity150504_noHs@35475